MFEDLEKLIYMIREEYSFINLKWEVSNRDGINLKKKLVKDIVNDQVARQHDQEDQDCQNGDRGPVDAGKAVSPVHVGADQRSVKTAPLYQVFHLSLDIEGSRKIKADVHVSGKICSVRLIIRHRLKGRRQIDIGF